MLEIEKTAIQMVPDVDTVLSIEICSGLVEHHAEDSWCQVTAIPHAVVDAEWL